MSMNIFRDFPLVFIRKSLPFFAKWFELSYVGRERAHPLSGLSTVALLGSGQDTECCVSLSVSSPYFTHLKSKKINWHLLTQMKCWKLQKKRTENSDQMPRLSSSFRLTQVILCTEDLEISSKGLFPDYMSRWKMWLTASWHKVIWTTIPQFAAVTIHFLMGRK